MKKGYLFLSVILLLVELLINQTDGFIRHTLGDFFAVILLYCIIKSFFQIRVSRASIISLSIAFGLELLQLTTLSEQALFNQFSVLKTLLGTSFSWGDLIAYSLGILFVLGIEKFLVKKII